MSEWINEGLSQSKVCDFRLNYQVINHFCVVFGLLTYSLLLNTKWESLHTHGVNPCGLWEPFGAHASKSLLP